MRNMTIVLLPALMVNSILEESVDIHEVSRHHERTHVAADEDRVLRLEAVKRKGKIVGAVERNRPVSARRCPDRIAEHSIFADAKRNQRIAARVVVQEVSCLVSAIVTWAIMSPLLWCSKGYRKEKQAGQAVHSDECATSFLSI